MLAVDTNVVVRYLTNDHPEQSARARALFGGEDLWVSTTVMLETEWVLRSAYRFKSDQIIAALRAMAGLPRVSVEASALVSQALNWAEQGMDFADAMHLAAAEGCEALVTFDQGFIKVARSIGASPVRAL